MRILTHDYRSKALCLSMHTLTLLCSDKKCYSFSCIVPPILSLSHPITHMAKSFHGMHHTNHLSFFWSRMPRMLYAWTVFHLEFFMMTVPHLRVPKTLMRSMVGSLVAPCGLRPVPSLRGVLMKVMKEGPSTSLVSSPSPLSILPDGRT